MSILIVDDNPTNLIIIQEILKKAGYRDLQTANSAQELFDYLQLEDDSIETEPPVNLILLDIMMPEVDGIEACRRIQQVDRLKDIPIIMVTAVGDSIKLAEALDAGAIDYVTKPVNKIELLARIRVALRLKYEKDWHKDRDRHIRSELELAKLVQSSVLSDSIEKDNIRIEAIYKPSEILAGDLYAWYPIDEHRYGVILLDVMGHGISSSLVSMYIASVLKDTITQYVDPDKVFQELNRRMNQLRIPDRFVQYYFTAFYAVIDTREKVIEYANAGHPPGILVLANGDFQLLDEGCCAIGFFDQISVDTVRISYRETSKLILFTDGIIEEKERGTDGSTEEWMEELRKSPRLDMEYFRLNLFEDETGTQQDDKCLVIVEMN